MERLKRLREPAAVVVVVALGLQLVLVLLLAVLSGAPIDVTGLPLAYYLADPALLILLTGLVIACSVGEPTPHARAVTVAALVLTAVALIGAAGIAVAGLALRPAGGSVVAPLLVGTVPPIAAGVVALGTFIALLRRPLLAPAATPALDPGKLEEESVDPQQQPGWASDTAVGTVWRRAGDATSQRPATNWDAPGASGSWWEPDPGPDAPPEPTRRTED